jgi:hypothetical protein
MPSDFLFFLKNVLMQQNYYFTTSQTYHPIYSLNTLKKRCSCEQKRSTNCKSVTYNNEYQLRKIK